MENKAEDEIRRRWEQEARESMEREQEAAQRPKKRARAIAYRNNTDDILKDVDLGALLEGAENRSAGSVETKSKARRTPRAQAKGRITEVTEEEDYVE